jgi:hypothetical protein
MVEPGASATAENPLVIVVSIGGALLSFGVMLALSLAGFHEGWRTGWACGNGAQFREVVWQGPTMTLLRRLLARRRRKHDGGVEVH